MKSASIVTGETIYSGDVNGIRDDARGATVLLPHQMLGTIAMGTNPSNTQTLTVTVNGTAIVIHFVTAIGAVANNVLIAGSAALTAINLYNFLTNPSVTSATQVAATTANQTLLSYLCVGLNTTTTVIGSMNKTIYAPLTSFSCSTTVTSATYTASTMKLYVEPGVCYVNGTQVKYLGGSTPAVTAPVSNPRIDVLTIDSSGTLAWTTGAENASPSAPTYPVNKLPICELYNVTSETILNDYENQAAGTGYIYNDVRPFAQTVLNLASVANAIIPDADGTRDLGSPSNEWNNVYAKTGIFLNGVSINSQITNALIATESITAGMPCSASLYQATPIAVDVKTIGTLAGGANSISVTIGNNSNRLLLVFASTDVNNGSPTTLAPTWNGGAMTNTNYQIASGFNRVVTVSYLVAPATGAHTLSITAAQAGHYAVYSLYNVNQSTPIEGQTGQGISAVGGSTSYTVVNDGSVPFGFVSNVAGTNAGISGNAMTSDSQTVSTECKSGDAGLTPGQGAGFVASVAFSASTVAMMAIATVIPATATSAGVQLASSAAANSRSQAFVGFANNSATAGQSVTVVTAGIVTGLSAVTASSQYYLNDTNGTIGTAAGTVTRKVGIGINATKLLITNIW